MLCCVVTNVVSPLRESHFLFLSQHTHNTNIYRTMTTNNIDEDSLLMPPPPPRLPKRQKVGADTHPNSIMIPPPSQANNNSSSNDGSVDSSSTEIECDARSRVGLILHNSSSNNSTEGKDQDICLGANDNISNDGLMQGDDDIVHSANDNDIKQKNQQPRDNGSSPSPASVSFRDIIGHGQAKLRLDEALLPLALPQDLAESVLCGIRAAPASILLHGPPGCGKTKLAKAVAGEAQAAFLSVGPSDILSKFVGESEASIRGLFREARRKARKMESKCAVIFFDEIDALGRSRVDEDSGKMSQAGGDNSSRRVLAELLIQMTELSHDNEEEDDGGEEEEGYDNVGTGGYCDDADGDSFSGRSTLSTSTGIFVDQRNDNGGSIMQPLSNALGTQVSADDEQHEVFTPTRSDGDGNTQLQQPKPRVIVVAATNRPEDCDPALLRRFAVRVLVGLPTRKDRKKIIRRLLSDVEHSITSPQLNELALATEGWSGSDLEHVTREAVMAPVRECLRAAAVLKKKASKEVTMQKRSGVDSAQKIGEQKKAEEAQHNATRESLLNGFRNLRAVSSKDFEDGIAFFLGDQDSFGCYGNVKQAHYDSSSSSESEGDEE